MPGPGAYEPKSIDSESGKLKMRNPKVVVPFSCQTPRFKDKHGEDNAGDKDGLGQGERSPYSEVKCRFPQETSIFKSKTTRAFPEINLKK